MYWALLGILFAVALLACAIGFKKFVYFLSVGYGFAIVACSIAIFIIVLVCANMNQTDVVLWLLILQCLTFVLYGARLSGFLLYREIKSANYKKVLDKEAGGDKKIPVFVLIFIWLFCAVLYVAQTSPVLFRFMNGSTDWIVPLIGVIISLIGLTLETLADLQKSAQKKTNPHMVATKGLYRMVRCPNYFGEITFWTGVFVSGVTTYSNCWGQWVVAVIAYICIVYIMFNGAQRLEKRQNKNYGDNPEYINYVSHTPALIPLIPVYHLTKAKKAEEQPAEPVSEEKKEEK